MPAHSIIPRAQLKAAEWGRQFVGGIEKYPQVYNVPLEEVQALRAMYDEFEALIAESHSENRRPGVLILKLSAFKNFERKARDIINAYLRKREISDPDRIKIGLPVYDKVRTRIQRPATQIQFSVMPYGYRGFKIKFHDGPSERQAKPKGITCALICCSFSDAPPTGYDINSRIFIATRSPYTLAFPEADRGKAVYIAMCWVNERGELGQWSAFFKVYIP